MRTLETEQCFDENPIVELRQLALQNTDLNQMVNLVQERLGFSADFFVPVLAYFCKAFSLPLIEVLPLREGLDVKNDPRMQTLLRKIRQSVKEINECSIK